MDASEFRDVSSRFTTGVCVVTSTGREGPSGLTANAVASLSLDPPLVLVCFDRASRTLAAVEQSRGFAVNVLAHEQEDLAARFASKLPEAEKFEAVAWSERSGAPALEGTIAGLACTLRELLPGGDHVIAIGEVAELWRGAGPPLVFYRGSYWSLGDREPAPSDVDRALEGP